MFKQLRRALARSSPAFDSGPRGLLTTAFTLEDLDAIGQELEHTGKSEISVYDEDGVMFLVTVLDANNYPQFKEV
jgi:hypothetical protein